MHGENDSPNMMMSMSCREALATFTPRQLRLMMALNPWDRRMAYGVQVQEEVKSREAQLKNFFSNVEVVIRKSTNSVNHPQKWFEEEMTLSEAYKSAAASIHRSFLDSINTRGALDAVSELIKATNVYLSARPGADGHIPQPMLLRQCAALVTRTLSVMGLTPYTSDQLGMDSMGSDDSEASKRTDSILDALSEFRDKVRNLAKSKSNPAEYLTCCDCLRDDALVEIGVRLEDKADGTSVWKMDDPATLRKERDEKMAAQAAIEKKKLNNKWENLKREIEKFAKIEGLPSVKESLSAKYSKFDADGFPTHDAEGQPLEGKAVDKAKKEVEKAKKVRLPYEKKATELGTNFLRDMKDQLHNLQAKLQSM